VLTRNSQLDALILRQAIAATFERRVTALPMATPIGLSDEFSSDAGKQIQWRAFIRKNKLTAPDLHTIIEYLRQYFESAIRSEG
jgi:hypothetical protein